MSQAATSQLVERAVEQDEIGEAPLSRHEGVLESKRRARENLPEWQRIEGDWWKDDDDLTHGARERMTRREREVWRTVEVHGLRLEDLARELQADPSTLRSVLESAREKLRGER